MPSMWGLHAHHAAQHPEATFELPPTILCEGVSPSDAEWWQEVVVRATVVTMGLHHVRFCFVPPDYYDHKLEDRRAMLGARSVAKLCKMVVVENHKWALATALPPPAGGMDATTVVARSRFFAVILQYKDQQFKKEKMEREVQRWGGMSKNQCQILFAEQSDAEELTGFVRNAVTVVGSASPLPVFISHHVAELPGGGFWLGGGAINLKLRVDTEELLRAMWPIVVDVTFVKQKGEDTDAGA